MNNTNTIALSEFAEAARGFCSWCEGPSLGSAPEVIAAVWISKLYSIALTLPRVEPENSDGPPDLPEIEKRQAENNLSYFNGHYYRTVFDPDPAFDDGTVMGDIGDDLLDTYMDIRAGLLLFEQNHSMEALWHWEFLHRVHWGHHAVGALYALHCMSISKQE